MHDFLGWRGESQLSGAEDNCVCNIDQHLQDIFFTNKDVVNDFKNYISFLLNHLNPLTGLAYKDDPTILAWETGNELYYPTYEWTVDIARYIKDEVGAEQLVMDGWTMSRTGVYPELADPDLLILYQEFLTKHLIQIKRQDSIFFRFAPFSPTFCSRHVKERIRVKFLFSFRFETLEKNA